MGGNSGTGSQRLPKFEESVLYGLRARPSGAGGDRTLRHPHHQEYDHQEKERRPAVLARSRQQQRGDNARGLRQRPSHPIQQDDELGQATLESHLPADRNEQ